MPRLPFAFRALATAFAVVAVAGLADLRTTPATAVGTGPTATSDRWALIVGITDYAGRTVSTAGGAGDAADFREALLRNGFPPDHIVTLTEARATAANVRAGLQWLVDHSGPNAFSVFHYSGHVKQVGGDRDGDGERVDEFLWSYDNVFLADAELADTARRLRGLAWFDIAGCEAAGFDEGISGPTRLFTASSRETEKSYEHPDWRNSIFTGVEIDQAILQGMGDMDGNGKVSIQEAFAFAADRAPELTARQRRGAQHPVGAGGEGPQWFLDGPPA
jgi:Caspase domain